ncbi:MAG: DUF763 domain-containing protein [Treponema sp.]|nr:DUF763 domain-containing protein [Treponema sp.]
MVKRTGYADLPLHTGTVPRWLADRMMQLGTQIVEALLISYGKKEVLRRLSDPLWFQSLGAVLGMDWHSSGITTSVMYALKRGINPRAREWGLCICGGRGKYSRKTPEELRYLGDAAGMDADALVRASRLCAKVDNTAVQDGFQLYQHNFILSDEGDWAVVQQGMNARSKTARRYHWCSDGLKSFVEEPHTGVTGENRGLLLNLTDRAAARTRRSILSLSAEQPDRIMKEVSLAVKSAAASTGTAGSAAAQLSLFPELAATGVATDVVPGRGASYDTAYYIEENSRNLTMPARHELKAEDVDLRRLGAVLAASYEARSRDFESLLLTPGLGPRTLQSLALVSEVIYGTPSRFRDPARFSFAHGGKDGHPFPVPTRIYDESIRILGDAVERSRLGYQDKSDCLRRLHATALEIEANCSPEADFDRTIAREKAHSREWGGRTVGGCGGC